MPDLYNNFKELSQNETLGVDFEIEITYKNSGFCIVAPHGGGIEPGTTELVKAIAMDDFSVYSFNGIKKSGNKRSLHLTSTNFDEPECLSMVNSYNTCLSVHGLDGSNSEVFVGGLDINFKSKFIEAFRQSGFNVIRDNSASHSGAHPLNICNRCDSGKGVQLEISKGLRNLMFEDISSSSGRKILTEIFTDFVSVVRNVLLN